jgi:hypothetical protein
MLFILGGVGDFVLHLVEGAVQPFAAHPMPGVAGVPGERERERERERESKGAREKRTVEKEVWTRSE